jgi:hypothetical protein
MTVVIDLSFAKMAEDLDLLKPEVYVTQRNIRGAATSEATQELLKNNPSSYLAGPSSIRLGPK